VHKDESFRLRTAPARGSRKAAPIFASAMRRLTSGWARNHRSNRRSGDQDLGQLLELLAWKQSGNNATCDEPDQRAKNT
jgi:hypothetical protein